ncbi:uncharacterized protein LOC144612197 [Rhinoraja longicauda]
MTDENVYISRSEIAMTTRPCAVAGNVKYLIASPNWDKQSEEGRKSMRELREIIIKGIREAVPKGQNFERAFENQQAKDEAPTTFLRRLRKNMQQYSGIDPESDAGQQLLRANFVWAGEGNRGGLRIPPLRIALREGYDVVRVRQYPISIEGRKGLQPIIENLLKEGVLESCMSPYNTPILPVRKTDGTFQLVQDLRELNKVVRTRYPVVPNPNTIMGRIPPSHNWFSVVDLKDAFWSCPLDEGSRDLFAFEWENPGTGRKQQYRWKVLPQGFTESPNLFGQILEQVLEEYPCVPRIQLLQYVDDLLISGEGEGEVRDTTIILLNFLGEKGLRVSRNKLQFVEQEVKGIYTLAKQAVSSCVICQKINKKVMRAIPGGGQQLAIRPFQRVQVDFTELPRVQKWKYLLVVVDHFTRWVEAFPTVNATSQVVAKILLEQIIPRYGIIESLDSDRGTHFASKAHLLICDALGIKWKLHTPWHPQSSGMVERMNGTLKTQITKLMEETTLDYVLADSLA